jgi:hypothetical protein
MMRSSLVVLATLGIVFAFGTARADDYNPPGWRGDPLTTYQQWVFGDSSQTPAPDDMSAEHPGVSMYVADNGPATVWSATDPIETTREGVWKTEDWLEITIQNFDQDNPLKEIWIQLTYKGEVNADIYAELVGGSDPYWATLIDETPISGSEYVNQTWQIFIEPNPPAEIIYIMPGTCTGWIDQVVIDTICGVPEPGTMLLLGLGGLALLRRRRG